MYASINYFIGSDNGLSSVWHEAIILTTAGILSFELCGTNISQIVVKIKKNYE